MNCQSAPLTDCWGRGAGWCVWGPGQKCQLVLMLTHVLLSTSPPHGCPFLHLPLPCTPTHIREGDSSINSQEWGLGRPRQRQHRSVQGPSPAPRPPLQLPCCLVQRLRRDKGRERPVVPRTRGDAQLPGSGPHFPPLKPSAFLEPRDTQASWVKLERNEKRGRRHFLRNGDTSALTLPSPSDLHTPPSWIAPRSVLGVRGWRERGLDYRWNTWYC